MYNRYAVRVLPDPSIIELCVIGCAPVAAAEETPVPLAVPPGKGLFDVSRNVTQALRKNNMRPEHPRYAERSSLEPKSETLKLSLRYTKTG
jgi:hypothetical protein